MESANPVKFSLNKIFSATFQTFKKKPYIYTPFIIFAILDFFGVMLVFLAPRTPFRPVLGPLIRTLWGERFLHYPANFLLLPRLASLSRMCLSVIAGSLLTGVAVAILYKKSLKIAFKKYVSLLLIVFIVTVLFYFSVKTVTVGLAKYFMAGHLKLLFLGPGLWMGPILISINLIIALLLQSAFVYAIPELISGNKKFIKAILKSFVFFKNHFVITILLVGLPMLIYIPIIVLNYNTAFLINRLFPEFIFWVAMLNIVVSSLVIDPLITISTALLYLNDKEKL